MNQSDLIFFELAYYFCIRKGDEEKNKNNIIEDAIKTFGSQVSDENELREYLYSEISFSSSDAASMLCSDERRGKDKEWWNKFKEENGGSGKYWNRYKAYLSGTKKCP